MVVRDYVLAVSESTQTPVDMSASAALGVSARTWRDWESGRTTPPGMLALACAALAAGLGP